MTSTAATEDLLFSVLVQLIIMITAARALNIVARRLGQPGAVGEIIAGLMLGPHFAMELHVHLAAAYPTEPWVEHFDWLEPLFNERMDIRDGRMLVPTRPGLGLTLSEQSRAWTRETCEVGTRP